MYSAALALSEALAPRARRLAAACSQRSRRCFRAGGSVIVTTLVVPKSGGVTSTKVNVVRWLKHEGEPVKSGEAIVELETEKISYELESPAAGVLLKIIAGETTEVPVGNPLGYIGQPGEAVPTP
jgi:pyruvate dehydrogenase E2 component (dihydrolipoamide acetyltransferase)